VLESSCVARGTATFSVRLVTCPPLAPSI